MRATLAPLSDDDRVIQLVAATASRTPTKPAPMSTPVIASALGITVQYARELVMKLVRAKQLAIVEDRGLPRITLPMPVR